jgi:hypothetical protein
MKTIPNPGESRKFWRALPFLFILAVFMGPPCARAQCNSQNPPPTAVSVTLSPGTVIGNSTGDVVTATVTLNSAPPSVSYIGITISGVVYSILTPLYYGQRLLACGVSSGPIQFKVGGVSQQTAVTVSVSAWGSNASATLTVNPNTASLSLSPSTVVGGSNQIVTGTVTLLATSDGSTPVGITPSNGNVLFFQNLYYSEAIVGSGRQSSQFNRPCSI